MRYPAGMARPYHKLLPVLFKRFSVASARRTLFPTLVYHATRPALPPSDKPALFTMNILPPMMTVWHHCAKKYLKDDADIVIFDCSGKLNPAEFPGARVHKFLNQYAATKSDIFLKQIARNRRHGWICDDDVFFTGDAVSRMRKEFEVPGTASVSFRPRTWWHYELEGKRYWPSGSYCIAFDREIFVNKEKLSLAPAANNPHPADGGSRPPGRYDTGDLANEILLKRGYRCAIIPEQEEAKYITAFSGLSGAVMLLWHFRTPEQTLDWFRGPPKKQWSGNVLFGVLAAMLAIRTVEECYETLKGRPYPLPSLPSRAELEALRKEHEQYVRKDQSFAWIDDASERLKKAL